MTGSSVSLWARVKIWGGRLRDGFPLTMLGFAVLGLSLVAYFGFGRPRVDYVIQLASLMGLALVTIALVGVGIATIWMARAWRGRPESEPVLFESRRGFGRGLRLPRLRVPLVEVSWHWTTPDKTTVTLTKERGANVETIERAGRLSVDEVTRRFVIEDAFGLARVALTRTGAQPVRVLPWLGALQRAPVLRSLSTGDDLSHPAGEPVGDRVDMRRYVPGDPLKLAMWKIYARTGQLMVRTPERAVAPSTQVLAYLISAEGDEPSAAAARLAVEAGLLGDRWVFGADGTPGAVDTREDAGQLILRSRSVRGGPLGDGAGLSAFFDARQKTSSTQQILFVPAKKGPWIERCVQAIQRPGVTTVVFIGVDGVIEANALGKRAQRWLKRPAPLSETEEAVVTSEALSEVARILSSAGAQVVSVDRVQGRELFLGVGHRGSTAWSSGRAA